MVPAPSMANSRAKADALPELEKRFQIRWRAAWLLALAGVTACAPVPLSDGERRTALRGSTERVILPTYQQLVSSTSELADELNELESSGAGADSADGLAQVDLAPARRAYLRARRPFEESLAFAFGPAVDLHSLANIDTTPLDATELDEVLAGDGKLDVKGVRLLGSNKRGLHGIEYLLFPEHDEALEAALLADDEAGRRQRQYLSSAAQVVADAAQDLALAWQPEGGNYARRFNEPGGPDSVNDTVQAGLDTLLNECVYLSELVANRKLGDPLGATSGGDIDPAAQESERSGASLSDILGNLRGMHDIYLGYDLDGEVEEPSVASLSSLVRAKSPATDLRAREAFAAAEASVLAIPEPLTSALEDSPSTVNEAYESVKNLKRVLATEVLGTLGASLKFSDNDGD